MKLAFPCSYSKLGCEGRSSNPYHPCPDCKRAVREGGHRLREQLRYLSERRRRRNHPDAPHHPWPTRNWSRP